MSLFTVTINFEDFSKAIMQVEAENASKALEKSLRESEAIEKYDQSSIEETIQNFLRINQIAMNYKGVWTWTHTNFENEGIGDIYGGVIIQTDKGGPLRKSGT